MPPAPSADPTEPNDGDRQSLGDLVARYSPARRRTADAALERFAVHGVGGTSLQMIADDLGLTKAAIYHQFPTKHEIVLAVVEVQLAPIEAALAEVDQVAPSGDPTRRNRLVEALVGAVVGHRRSLGVLQGDPVLFRTLGEHPPSLHLWTGLFRDLLGDDLSPRVRVRASALSAVLGTVAYPLVQDLDDDTLRAELSATVHALLPA